MSRINVSLLSLCSALIFQLSVECGVDKFSDGCINTIAQSIAKHNDECHSSVTEYNKTRNIKHFLIGYVVNGMLATKDGICYTENQSKSQNIEKIILPNGKTVYLLKNSQSINFVRQCGAYSQFINDAVENKVSFDELNRSCNTLKSALEAHASDINKLEKSEHEIREKIVSEFSETIKCIGGSQEYVEKRTDTKKSTQLAFIKKEAEVRQIILNENQQEREDLMNLHEFIRKNNIAEEKGRQPILEEEREARSIMLGTLGLIVEKINVAQGVVTEEQKEIESIFNDCESNLLTLKLNAVIDEEQITRNGIHVEVIRQIISNNEQKESVKIWNALQSSIRKIKVKDLISEQENKRISEYVKFAQERDSILAKHKEEERELEDEIHKCNKEKQRLFVKNEIEKRATLTNIAEIEEIELIEGFYRKRLEIEESAARNKLKIKRVESENKLCDIKIITLFENKESVLNESLANLAESQNELDLYLNSGVVNEKRKSELEESINIKRLTIELYKNNELVTNWLRDEENALKSKKDSLSDKEFLSELIEAIDNKNLYLAEFNMFAEAISEYVKKMKKQEEMRKKAESEQKAVFKGNILQMVKKEAIERNGLQSETCKQYNIAMKSIKEKFHTNLSYLQYISSNDKSNNLDSLVSAQAQISELQGQGYESLSQKSEIINNRITLIQKRNSEKKSREKVINEERELRKEIKKDICKGFNQLQENQTIQLKELKERMRIKDLIPEVGGVAYSEGNSIDAISGALVRLDEAHKKGLLSDEMKEKLRALLQKQLDQHEKQKVYKIGKASIAGREI